VSAQSMLQRFVAKLLHDIMKNSDKVASLDLRFIIAHLLPPVLDYWTAFLERMPAAHQAPYANMYPVETDSKYTQYILVGMDRAAYVPPCEVSCRLKCMAFSHR
jgi:hypothetical protein